MTIRHHHCPPGQHRQAHPAWALLPLCAALSGATLAAEPQALEPVVVTASRQAEKASDVPAAVSVVSDAQIARQQARHVADVLQDLPGVDFPGGPRGAGRLPLIRGYGGKSITLLLDGARQNDASGLSGAFFIDPFWLAGAEVLRGPSSSLYGSGGLGGVISMRTAEARDLLRAGQELGADGLVRRDSAEHATQALGRVYGQSGNQSWLLGAGAQRWGWLRQGGGSRLQPNDGSAQEWLGQWAHQIDGHTRQVLKLRQYQEQSLRPNNPQADAALDASGMVPVQLNRTRQQQWSWQIERTPQGQAPGWQAQLYRTQLDTLQEAHPEQFLAEARSMTRTTGASVQGQFEWGRHRVLLGLDHARDRQSAEYDHAPNSVQPDGTQTVWGLFALDRWQEGDWEHRPGLRLDRYDTQVQTPGLAPASRQHASPRWTTMWRAAPGLQTWVTYSEAFRAPSLGEAYMDLHCTGCYFNFAANPGLKPETERALEWGAGHQVRSLWQEGDRFLLQASVFRGKARDLITTEVVGSYTRTFPFDGEGLVLQSQNQARAVRTGLEASAQWRQGPWQLEAAYSRLRVENPVTGAQLMAPPDKLVLSAQWRQGDIALGWHARLVDSQRRDSTVERRTAGHGTHDLWGEWQLSRQALLRLQLQNLADKRYVAYGSDNPAAQTLQTGRSLKLAAEVRL